MITRRALLATIATMILCAPVNAKPKKDETPNMIPIAPVTPITGKKGVYAETASPGPYIVRPEPAEIEPIPGLKLFAWIPLNMPASATPGVIVFSHDAFTYPRAYSSILAHWASHGFAVFAPLHNDSVIAGGLSYKNNMDGLLEDTNEWRSRTQKCRQILDVLPEIERTTRLVFDKNHIIVAGHSYGAFTAQLLLGARAHIGDTDEITNEADPRFFAGLLLSPQGPGVMGLDNHSWERVDSPIMVVTGDGDFDLTQQDALSRTAPFYQASPGNKHLAWMKAVRPTWYTGTRITVNTEQIQGFQDILALTTSFVRSYGFLDERVLTALVDGAIEGDAKARMILYYR